MLGFYFIWFPRHIVKMWVLLFPFYVGVVRIRAMLVLVAYLVLDNLLPFLLVPEGGGVAHGARRGDATSNCSPGEPDRVPATLLFRDIVGASERADEESGGLP